MAQTYQRYDHTMKGAGLANEGYSLQNPQQVLEYFNRMSTAPHDANEKRFAQKVRTYAKNNPGNWNDPNYVTQAVDWAFRDDMRNNKKPPKMFGALDSILKPALTIAAGAINPYLGAAVGGGLGAANDGGVMGGLLGAAGGYTAGSAIPGIKAALSNAGGWSTFVNAPGTFASNLGRGALTSLQNVIPGYGGSMAPGGAASLALKTGTTAAQALAGSGGGGGNTLTNLLTNPTAIQLGGAALAAGSGSGTDAYDRELLNARNSEAGRQALRAQGANQVNATFANQDDFYNRLRSSIFDFQNANLDERMGNESRELKFELARRGHLGGSQEVDAMGDLLRLRSDGRLRAGSLADDAVARARGADQAAKTSAIRDISLDVDANSAISNAVSQSQIASQQAADAARGEDIGQVFNNLGYLYQQGQVRKGQQRAAATAAGWGRGGSSVGPASTYQGTTGRK